MLFKIVILTLTVLTSDGTFNTDVHVMQNVAECVRVAENVSAKLGMVPHDITCHTINLGEV